MKFVIAVAALTGLVAAATITPRAPKLAPVPRELLTKTRRDLSSFTGTGGISSRAIQVEASDFYECASTATPPKLKDCKIVVNSVSGGSGDVIVISSGTCLTFGYGTCLGYFCSICQYDLGTTTKFIGEQLANAQDLCVNDGAEGAVLSQKVPQWQAGLLSAEMPAVPDYSDVCSS